MRRRWFLSLLAAPVLFAQQPLATFRAGVTLVRVDAQVMEGDRIVSGLTKEDFVVRDNGKPQPILYFGQEEVPLDLILLFDTSGSMRFSVEQVSRAAHGALFYLKKGDRVGVLRFTMRAQLVEPFTANFEQAEQAVERLCDRRFRGGTNIHGALEASGEYLLEQPRSDHRRAILLISDGKSPRFSREITVLKKLWEADAVLHALLVKSSMRGFSLSLTIPPANVDVSKLAEETGGEAIKVDKAGEGFRQIMERIRRRYSLHYALPEGSDGEQRSVKVELSESGKRKAPGGRVRARKGYVWRAAPSDSSAGASSLRSSTTLG
ncbi:MAG: VWA domain-containing protein [Acidobacteria bacterium]|nr:VWA domain-containing protein [Acidobacteriota bacterium]